MTKPWSITHADGTITAMMQDGRLVSGISGNVSGPIEISAKKIIIQADKMEVTTKAPLPIGKGPNVFPNVKSDPGADWGVGGGQTNVSDIPKYSKQAYPADPGPYRNTVDVFLRPIPPTIPAPDDRLMDRLAKKFSKAGSQEMANQWYERLNSVAWPSYISTGDDENFAGWVKKLIDSRDDVQKAIDLANAENRVSLRKQLRRDLDSLQTTASLNPDMFMVRASDRIQNPLNYKDTFYKGNPTVFDAKWMKKTTLGFLYQARGLLTEQGWSFERKDTTALEHTWHFWRVCPDSDKIDHIDLVGLKGNYFVFDCIVNEERRPEMTMNPMAQGDTDQGVPLSMVSQDFAGYLTPAEAYLYQSNLDRMLVWLKTAVETSIKIK